ncbi:hypothetical protein, partial [Actinomadura kijaniata]|uniref:hypothetical protein n=1 Tax=Actinomadura kijaniata TaxID=46161 RepID=UPI003CD06A46
FGASGRRQLRLRFAWGNVVPMGHREDRAQWQASSVTQSNGRGAIQSLEHFLNNLDSDLEKLDASVTAARTRRDEIAGNLRPKDENPYRIQARSKEREERALGKLVVVNEKEAALAERVERAASVNEDAAEEVTEELTTLREHIASLRQAIAEEHEIQARAQGLVQPETRTGDDSDASGTEETPQTRTAPAGEAASTEEQTPATAPPAAATEQQQDAPPAEPQGVPDPVEPDTDLSTGGQGAPAPEEPREQQFRDAVDELFPEAALERVEHAPAAEETDGHEQNQAEETAPLQELIDALGDQASVTHIGGPQHDG